MFASFCPTHERRTQPYYLIAEACSGGERFAALRIDSRVKHSIAVRCRYQA